MAEVEPLLLRAAQAEPRYNAAVQAAAAACAADTVGQTCYICMDHGDEAEGLVRGCSCRGENGFVHVSCLVRAAQVAVERGGGPGWRRWDSCGLCEQSYHGVVACALGWACWKTYLGRPEKDQVRGIAMSQLGLGLSDANHDEDALPVQEAELAMKRRIGAPESQMLLVQTCLANSHARLGRNEQAANMLRDVYSGHVRLNGEEHGMTLVAANNYANILLQMQGFEEAKAMLQKRVPVTRRVLGESNEITLKMRKLYAFALYADPSSTLDDYREAVATLEDVVPIARRALGAEHPLTPVFENHLKRSRAALRARETPSGSA